MREILFRGKRVDNGKWVHGFYIENELFDGRLEPSIIPVDEKGAALYDDDGYNIEIKVNPETVGQYTGLTDKNGKKIFEGDILSGQLDDLFPTEESIYEVVWHDYGWHIRNNSGIDTADKEWIRQYFKVIGNIYDNPELLER